MLKITVTNYKRYKKVFGVILKFIWRDHPSFLESDSSPFQVLDSWENKSMSIAKKGLKHGLLDVLTQVKIDLPEIDKPFLDRKLLDEGLPGLWELMSIVNDIPAKVLKRGKIKNLDEWYIIKEELDAIDSDISKTEREKLNRLFYEFETNYNKKKSI